MRKETETSNPPRSNSTLPNPPGICRSVVFVPWVGMKYTSRLFFGGFGCRSNPDFLSMFTFARKVAIESCLLGQKREILMDKWPTVAMQTKNHSRQLEHAKQLKYYYWHLWLHSADFAACYCKTCQCGNLLLGQDMCNHKTLSWLNFHEWNGSILCQPFLNHADTIKGREDS